MVCLCINGAQHIVFTLCSAHYRSEKENEKEESEKEKQTEKQTNTKERGKTDGSKTVQRKSKRERVIMQDEER